MRRIGLASWLVTGLGVIFFATGWVKPSFGAPEEHATGLTLDRAVLLALERNVDVLVSRFGLDRAEANLARFRDVVAITDLRVQHGEIPEADLIRAQVEALRFEDEVSSAGLALAAAKTRLVLLAGLEEPVDAIEIIGSLDQDSDDATPGEAELGLDRLIELAEVHRPDLAAAQARQNRADSEVKLTKMARRSGSR